MTDTLIVQSHRPDALAGWMGRCVESVCAWAAGRGYAHRVLGDELFDPIPDWYLEKVAPKRQVAADLGRLLALRDALASGYRRVAWLDADVLLFAPKRLSIDIAGTCAFGRERWVEADGTRYRVRRNVHNAICVFRRADPVLPFLIHATGRIVERIDPDHIAPQVVGPKLLTALHGIVGFELIDAVGAFSPPVLADVARGHGPAIDRLRAATPAPLAGANLAASLAGDDDLGGVCERLMAAGGLPG